MILIANLWCDPSLKLKYDITVDVEDIQAEVPTDFTLYQNYPNPFNPSTKIKYTIPFVETHRDVSLQTALIIYDVLGNEVAVLVNEEKPAGNYEVEFNANGLTSGIYFYQLRVYPAEGGADGFVQTKKMVLLR
jgi:hypothetical protein